MRRLVPTPLFCFVLFFSFLKRSTVKPSWGGFFASVRHFHCKSSANRSFIFSNESVRATYTMLLAVVKEVHHGWLGRHLLVLGAEGAVWGRQQWISQGDVFFRAYSHCKCFLCTWEHSDAGLMLSLTAIPATHTFLKNLSLIPVYCLWTTMVQQHTWQLLLSSSSNKWNCALFLFFLFFVFFCKQCILYLCICPMVTWDLESNIILIRNMSRGSRFACQVGLKTQ